MDRQQAIQSEIAAIPRTGADKATHDALARHDELFELGHDKECCGRQVFINAPCNCRMRKEAVTP